METNLVLGTSTEQMSTSPGRGARKSCPRSTVVKKQSLSALENRRRSSEEEDTGPASKRLEQPEIYSKAWGWRGGEQDHGGMLSLSLRYTGIIESGKRSWNTKTSLEFLELTLSTGNNPQLICDSLEVRISTVKLKPSSTLDRIFTPFMRLIWQKKRMLHFHT